MASINDHIGKYRILADLGGGTFAHVYEEVPDECASDLR